MRYLTIEERIEYCKSAIETCIEKIEIEGINGNAFWKEFKLKWEEELERYEKEYKDYSNFKN